MQTIYDILGSMIIGGIIMLMLLSFNSSVMEGAAVQMFSSVVQSNVTSLTEMIEFDFRKMGYRVGSIHDTAIVYADSNAIRFRGDTDNDGVPETISYVFDAKKKSGHVNPRTRILWRQVDGGEPVAINLGLTRFRLAYYDADDKLITEQPVKKTGQIRSFRLAVNIESTSPYDAVYTGGTWERTITPKNLR